MQRPQSGRSLLAWGILAVILLASRSLAQGSVTARGDTTDQSYRYRLLGVFDAESGLPVEDAQVLDILSGSSALTSPTGTVSLFFLPDGGSMVRIRKVGYAMQTMMVAISPADTAPVTVALQPIVMLPEVVTTGGSHYISPWLRGFETRRHMRAAGYFVPETELRKEDGRTLANVLVSHVPGVNIRRTQYKMLLEPSPRCPGRVPPDVYLDGMPWPHPLLSDRAPLPGRRSGNNGDSLITAPVDSTPVPQPIDISDFPVEDLAGIEYYPDALLMPMQFPHTPGACGALLLWTREG